MVRISSRAAERWQSATARRDLLLMGVVLALAAFAEAEFGLLDRFLRLPRAHDGEMTIEVLELGLITASALAIFSWRRSRELVRENRERIAAERQYRTLFERANDGILIFDPADETILAANARAGEVYGLTADALIGRSLREFSGDIGRGERAIAMMLSLPGDQASDAFEFAQRRADGTPIAVLARASLIEYQGRPAILTINRDVTAQRQDARRLERQNAYFAALHEVALGLMRHHDPRDMLEAIIARAADLLATPDGYIDLFSSSKGTLEATIGIGRYRELPAYEMGPGEGLGGTVWQTGRPLVVQEYSTWSGRIDAPEYAALHAAVGVPLTASSGVVGVLGLARTEAGIPFTEDEVELLSRFGQLASIALENARLYDRMRESEANLSTAQRIAHLGSWEWDVATGALSWSDETFHNFGLAPGSVGPTFERFMDAVHPEDRASTDAAIQAALTGQPFAAEMRVVWPDGTIRIIEAQGEVVHDASGQPIRMIGTGHDITERKQADERLHRYAYYDVLTELPNRYSFSEMLTAAVRRTKAEPGYRFAVLFLDLDRFKTVNDSLGHHRGDRLLAMVADRLRECMAPGATVARFGGDEFAILLEGTSDTGAAIAAGERVHAALNVPFHMRGLELRTTASIGIALSDRRRGADELLRDADTAMYRAKAGGRGRSVVFDAGMHAAVTQQLMLESDLQRALERDEFRLVYQPIVLLATGQVVGFEALARWEHPRMGLLSPAEFIPIAEETGFIVPFGAWALRAACAQLAAWRAQTHGADALTIGVNISGQQLVQHDFVGQVERILAETGIPAAALQLEITERLLVDYTEAALTTLAGLRALGIGIDLDDFGVEYSALNYLRRFPIDAIKIDRSFVRELLDSERDRKVVQAIVELAHSLELNVTAEGIETFEQKARLEMLGCDKGQGLFFAKPVSGDDALVLFAPDNRRRQPVVISAIPDPTQTTAPPSL